MKISSTQNFTQKRQTFKMNVNQGGALPKAMFDFYLRHGAVNVNSIMGKLNLLSPEATLSVLPSEKPGMLRAVVAQGKDSFDIEALSADLLTKVLAFITNGFKIAG